jgi:hypothetical protein
VFVLTLGDVVTLAAVTLCVVTITAVYIWSWFESRGRKR